ncbi:MAG: TolC family outer membrane protein [Pseudomonadota bacterium]
MKRKAMRRTAAAAVLALMAAGPAAAQTLADSLIGAYRTSGLLEQNRALLRAADEDVAQAVAALRPVIDYLGTVRYQESDIAEDVTSNLSLEASLLLFDFGLSRLSIDFQKETVLALREALRSVEQNVLLRGVAAFLNVQRQIAFVDLAENNVRVISEQLRAARDRFEVGEVTRTDVSIAEARLASAQSSLAAERGALVQARAEYLAVVGSEATSLSPAPPPPVLPATLEEARVIALGRHPDLLEAQRNVTAAEIGIEVARAGLRPELRATASVGIDDDGEDTSSIGLSLSGPIYRGGALVSAIRQSQARRDSSRGELYTVGQQIELDVTSTWADLAVAGARVQASEQEVRAAALALEGAQEELEVGSRTTLDVLDLEQDLLDARTDQVSNQIDRVLSVYTVLSSMGLLTVDYLQLGIPTYDPAAYYNAVKNAPTVYVSPQGERLDRVLRRLNGG